MRVLQAAWEDASSGLGGFVLLAGEAGIGKTRLAEALAASVDGQVTWGRAWEGGGAPAYWPWREALRTIGAEAELDGSDASEADRFALFAGVGDRLRAQAAERPLLIVLDDLHAADGSTLHLLQYVARAVTDAHVLIVGTARPSGNALLQAGQRVDLGGLDPAALAKVIEDCAGRPAPEHVVALVHEATDGNPFFAGEIARLLAGDPALGQEGRGSLPLPSGVRDAIRRRLAPLPAEDWTMLETAAVIGREFPLAVLEHAADVPRAQLVEIADRAVAGGLLEDSPARPGELRFAHNLIREVLYDGLAPSRRMRLHGAVAAALQRRRRTGAELPELAHHLLAAAPLGDAAAAADVAERAAEWAVSVHAYEQAAELLDGALMALDLIDDVPEERRGRLMLEKGRALLRAGGAARETLRSVAEMARELRSGELLASTGIDWGNLGPSPGRVDTELVTILEDALELLPDEDSALRARSLARLAVALYFGTGTRERRTQLVADAVAMARRLDDPRTLADVLSNGHTALWEPATNEQGLAWSEETLALADAVGERELGIQARWWRVDLLYEQGHHAAAEVARQALIEVTKELGQGRFRWRLPIIHANRELLAGRVADATRHNAEAGAEGARVGDPMAPLLCGAQLAWIHYARGSFPDLLPLLRGAVGQFPGMPIWRVALALALAQAGDAEEARHELHHVCGDGMARLPRDNVFLPAALLAADACRELEEAALAVAIEPHVAPYAGRNIASPAIAMLGPVERVLGLLAAARSDTRAAREHLGAALAAAERQGARAIVAHITFDQARLDGDAGVAARAAELAERLGLDGLVARARALAGNAEAVEPPAPVPAAPSGGSLVRDGAIWTIRVGGRSVHLQHAKGLAHLALLLANPGVELHALEINGLGRQTPESSVPVLDAEAKRAYRARIEDLRDTIEEAERFGDPERAAAARQEMQAIADELAGAVGLGGRDRRLGSDAERARVNVTRAIRAVLKRIHEHDERLAAELETTIHTGTFCSYRPDPRNPVRWDVRA